MNHSCFLARAPRAVSPCTGALTVFVVAALMPWGVSPALAQEAMAAPVTEITGHRSEVRFLQYLDPDGRTIISSSFDSLVVWDAENGNEIRRLIDRATVFPFAVSPDGSRVMTVHRDGATIVDPATGEVVVRFDPERAAQTFRPLWSPGGEFIATTSGGLVHLWNPLSAELMRSFETEMHGVPTVAWSHDESQIAVIGRDGVLLVFNSTDGTRVFEVDAHSDRGALELVWSPSGEFVATGGSDGLVKIWNASDWTLAHTLQGMSSVQVGLNPPGAIGPPILQGLPISALAFSPDSRHIASADDSVRIWDVETGEELRRWFPDPSDNSYVPHFGTITDLEFDPSGAYLATAGLDASAKVWEVKFGAQVANVDTFLGPVETVDWSPDGMRVAMASADGASVIWNLATRQEQARFDGHLGGTVISLDFAPGVPRLVTSGRDGAVKVWYTETGGQLFDLPPLDEGASRWAPVSRPATQVSYSPASNAVLTLSDSQSGSILETRTVSTKVGPAFGLGFNVTAAAWSPDARRVAAAGYGVYVLDLADRHASTIFIEPDGPGSDTEIEHVAWSRDGERLLTGSRSGAAIWDWMSGRKLFAVYPQEGASYVEEAADGSLLLTIDGRFRIRRAQTWSLESQAEAAVFERQGARVNSARFLDGGKRVITTYSRDPVVRVWDALTGKELMALTGHRGRVLGMAVSPDRTLVATASVDRTVRLWDAATGQELAVLGPRPGPIIGVRFSPDGSQIAAYGVGGAVLWEPVLVF